MIGSQNQFIYSLIKFWVFMYFSPLNLNKTNIDLIPLGSAWSKYFELHSLKHLMLPSRDLRYFFYVRLFASMLHFYMYLTSIKPFYSFYRSFQMNL